MLSRLLDRFLTAPYFALVLRRSYHRRTRCALAPDVASPGALVGGEPSCALIHGFVIRENRVMVLSDVLIGPVEPVVAAALLACNAVVVVVLG